MTSLAITIGTGRRTGGGWTEFVSTLSQQQRRALVELRKMRQANLNEFRIALGLASNNELAGLLTGVIRNATGSDVDMGQVFRRRQQVFRRRQQGSGKRRVVTYSAGDWLLANEL